jgi:flagellar biosynthetic protein FliP
VKTLVNGITKKQIFRIICLLLLSVGILCIHNPISAHAAQTDVTDISTVINQQGMTSDSDELMEPVMNSSLTITMNEGNGEINGSLRILITLTLIAIAPTLLILLTCYTRVIIVLHFTRAALNTQTAPPNQVLIGLALFLTFFIMTPTIERIQTEAIVPFEEKQITQLEAVQAAVVPIREFMYKETLIKDVNLFMDIAGKEWDGVDLEQIPTSILIPSFIIGELRQAFFMGFIIYVPFIVIDMVVASVLMSMGMMMLPPTTISMPFKILLFVLADGWSLVIGNLVRTFY